MPIPENLEDTNEIENQPQLLQRIKDLSRELRAVVGRGLRENDDARINEIRKKIELMD